MTYRHGVYTSEVSTSIQTAAPVDSALPYVVGAAAKSFPPTVVSTWQQFVKVSGITEGVDDVPGEDGWHKLSLVSFAYLWFRVCGRGDCILRGIASADGSLSLSQLSGAIDDIDTTYERVRRLPSILLVPYYGGSSDVWALLKSKAELYGGRFRAVALGDVQCTTHALSGATPVVISDPSDVAAAKTVTSPAFALLWPYVGIGSMRFDLSSVCAAVMNRVDAQNGNLPFVSPSNKNAYATGVYVIDATKSEVPLFQSRDEVNSALGANGIIGVLNTADGWVVWGNNTTAFPGNTDVKDNMLPIRRMFNYVGNQFHVFADARIDLPLNVRQLEGVIKSFNQFLAGLVGFGALNAASVELDSERNTTESLLSGTVYVRIRIAPPPAMVVIEGVLEYDVRGFERSLA